MTKTMRELIDEHTDRQIHKWDHFYDIYDEYFSQYRGTDVCILEIGIQYGGSLQLWRKYFGEKAQIYAVDINPKCLQATGDNVQIFIGDQENPEFLNELLTKIPKIDILIDDGGHFGKQQIATFEKLFKHISPNGLYICEDLNACYRLGYNGGFRRKGTFVEYAKDMIDMLQLQYIKNKKFSDFQNLIHSETGSMHFYDNLFVLKKKPRIKAVSRISGQKEWEN